MQLDRFECRMFAGWRLAASALPVIVLLKRRGEPAAALFYSRSHFGIPTGVVKGGNNSREKLIVAPTSQRVAVLQAATQKLFSSPWVYTVAASLRSEMAPAVIAPGFPLAGCVWRSREIRTNLSLEGGFEEFLSRQRPRSRRNYRYFRRRAEQKLGLVFGPHLQVDDAAQDVAELHAASVHPMPWRRSIQIEAALREIPGLIRQGRPELSGPMAELRVRKAAGRRHVP